MPRVTIVGGGLSGVEAAFAASRLGCDVVLYEMRPKTMTPAHATGHLAELVCSNSLGSLDVTSASGLLKEEMRRLGSLVLQVADVTRVPAGRALAVDRCRFARKVTERLQSEPRVSISVAEATEIPEPPAVVATGPLTSASLLEGIMEITGRKGLHFYDAVAPIVSGDSIDLKRAFLGSRYLGEEASDYVNCPLDNTQYGIFREALQQAEQAPRHDFDPVPFFEGCLPVEELARRGPDTLRFGPLKPVGLVDPKSGRQPYAVVQLRREDTDGRLFNMVGFQTGLKWSEQKRVFRMIPGLEKAEFLRYGVMHRNTYISSPGVLDASLEVISQNAVFFAGQITGVEGYMESAATGILAGVNAARRALGEKPVRLPPEMMLGALARYVSSADPDRFQPMSANFGLLPPLESTVKPKRKRHEVLAARALEFAENMAKIMTYAIAK